MSNRFERFCEIVTKAIGALTRNLRLALFALSFVLAVACTPYPPKNDTGSEGSGSGGKLGSGGKSGTGGSP
ncbi:MAG TPA: hypothetical protein VIM14_15130, partial [Polyangia bacterium]